MVTSSGGFDVLLIADLCQQMQEMRLRVSKLEEMETRMDEMQQEIDELRRTCTCKYSDAIISVFRSECPDEEDPQKFAGNKSERIYGVPSVGNLSCIISRISCEPSFALARKLERLNACYLEECLTSGSKKKIAYVIKNLRARAPKSSDVAVEPPVSLHESGLPSRSVVDVAGGDEEDFSCVTRSGNEMSTATQPLSLTLRFPCLKPKCSTSHSEDIFTLIMFLQNKPKLSTLRKCLELL
ncbi:hypothetical protein EDC96DRAFT_570373 [Choanephora cucurbitarum]|nr:hypothetical protein EDC96DRAFT_570373 [Choanephora cucurbitarum]